MSGEETAPVAGGARDHLAAELRALRAGTGLSLAALATRTPYSKSSWERYLNGRKPVPRRAVEALCTVAGEPPARLLALWELADASWSGRSGAAPEPPPAPASGAVRPVRRRKWQPYALMAAGALAGAAAVALGVLGLGMLGPGGPQGGAGAPVGPSRAGTAEAGCLGERCVGRTPKGMGCGQSGAVRSLAERTARNGQRLEIRYSSVCRAVWVRASFLEVGDRVALHPPPADEGDKELKTIPKVMRAEAVDVGDATHWVVTPMLAPRDPADVRACLEPSAGGAPECFTGRSAEDRLTQLEGTIPMLGSVLGSGAPGQGMRKILFRGKTPQDS